jgi:hypothetical protein
MAIGERVALEGVLAQLKPRLALEIGTAEGGSLERIAAHSAEVHAIDLTGERIAQLPDNAIFHEGDSKQELPRLLEQIAAEGRRVDFALVDGDHSAAGARADLGALLDSPALSNSIVLVHDSFNPHVRAGIESLDPIRHPSVRAVDIDFVPGRLGRRGPFDGQMVGGFALLLLENGTGETPKGVNLGLWSLNPAPVLVHDAYSAAPIVADRVATGGEVPLLAPESIRRNRPSVDRDRNRGRSRWWKR